MPDLTMPTLGADMRAGRLLEWLIKPGQEIHRGDLVAVVDTDKAEIEIETFHDGVVGELLVEEGAKVPVGTVLATIVNGATPAQAAQETAAQETAPQEQPTPEQPAPAHHARVSPLARRMATELGLDAGALQGTGPHGSVVRADVEAAAAPASEIEPPAAEKTVHTEPDRAAAMRQAIGALMARSKREVPHYYLGTHIDMTAALDWLGELNAERPVARRVLPAVLLLKATALAAAEHADLNGFWEQDAFRPADGVHLGVAVARRGGGLVAPALHDADRLTLDALMDALRDLVHRVRRGRMRGSEMRDPTLTVTNLGDQGVETVHGVIYPPQVALVGFGAIAQRPWATGDMVGAHPVVHATLAADHRASDGHTGGLFLAAIERRLQEPEQL